MIACKDCIHENVCGYYAEFKDDADNCTHFKNKADYVEVKHGWWENISGFDVCNICGTSPADWEAKPNNPQGYPPYCHNCGAKMDGRKDE